MGFDLNRVIRGRVWKFGDSIETDAINPYYRYPTMEIKHLYVWKDDPQSYPRSRGPYFGVFGGVFGFGGGGTRSGGGISIGTGF